VGVVLSGGGAKGAAHIGFLKEIEAAGIPIDFVTGTSMGALVAAYYAAGWSPEEMESLLATEAFAMRVAGESPWRFGFASGPQDASLVDLRFSSIGGFSRGYWVSSLPTDWALMSELGPAAAAARGNFDSLFVPFRCVAADVTTKSDVVFASGDLATAVRASMTFPFYLEPIAVDGNYLYDGGLYNNFPSDVAYQTFMPDVLLGSLVSSPNVEPSADNLAAQIEAMVTRPSNFDPICPEMVIVRPDTPMGTFDFDRVGEAVEAGEVATRAWVDSVWSILLTLQPDTLAFQPSHPLAVQQRRRGFRDGLPPFVVGQVQVEGLTPGQTHYAERIIGRPKRVAQLERNLHFLLADEHIASARPVAQYRPESQRFDVHILAKSERDLRFRAGGSFSSSPVSFGYAGVSYSRFSRVPLVWEVNSAFGNFYSAIQSSLRLDTHGPIPVAIQPEFLLHRWNHVRSFATFYQDVRPSYMVLTERQAGLSLRSPLGPDGQLTLRATQLQTQDDYYPERDFLPSDTTDRTSFQGWVVAWGFRHSDMPEKMLNREGRTFAIHAQRFSGVTESYLRAPFGGPARSDTLSQLVNWARLVLRGEQYWTLDGGRISLGGAGVLVASDEPLRASYRGSLIQATAFQPTLGSRMRFSDRYRAYNYAALGGILDVRIKGNLRWRAEGHLFRPFDRVAPGPEGAVVDLTPAPGGIGGTWLVLQSPVGLVTLGIEHLWGELDPWIWEFSVGYRIFRPSERLGLQF
jgi:NTE family protein